MGVSLEKILLQQSPKVLVEHLAKTGAICSKIGLLNKSEKW